MKKNEYRKYRIPSKLKVGGYIYDILFPYMFNENSTLLGQHDLCNHVIKLGILSPSHQNVIMPVKRVHENLMHEAIHAIDHVYCGHMLTEVETSMFALAWHCILEDNNLGITKGRAFNLQCMRIMNVDYTVKYVMFNDMEDDDISLLSVNTTSIILDKKMELGIKRVDNHYVWSGIIEMLNTIIIRTMCMERLLVVEDPNNGNVWIKKLVTSFSHGMFQVLYDNNIEGVIRGGK